MEYSEEFFWCERITKGHYKDQFLSRFLISVTKVGLFSLFGGEYSLLLLLSSMKLVGGFMGRVHGWNINFGQH